MLHVFWRNKNGTAKKAERWPITNDGKFVLAKAERAVGFIQTLSHVKGELAGKPFKLSNWQLELTRGIFGWYRPDGTRMFRKVYIEVPRKNGKSTWGAALGLTLLFADDEQGAEIYSAAADRDQAGIVFDIARTMVANEEDLSQRSDVFRKSIVYRKSNSAYHVLSADAPTKHGKNSHGILFDELHAQPNRELFDVLNTSTGARRQPLTMCFTTAGWDRKSICWEQHDYAIKVASGVIHDPGFLPVIYAADEKDDWTKPKIWKKANPNFGISVNESYISEECERAKLIPAYQNTFRRLHLNQWTQQAYRWMDLMKWDACALPVDLKALEGRVCYGGLDLATTTDIAAFVLVFPPKGEEPYYVLPYFWVPEENLMERARKDAVSYDAWVRDGLIDSTSGDIIDYRAIIEKVTELGEKYQISCIAFDRWGSVAITNDLTGAGFTMAQFGQGVKSMSPPTKELMALVLSKNIAHGGNPVLRWMADNLAVSQDPAGNIKPDRNKSSEKIDGMVALIMALDLAIRNEGGNESVYDTRGILTL